MCKSVTQVFSNKCLMALCQMYEVADMSSGIIIYFVHFPTQVYFTSVLNTSYTLGGTGNSDITDPVRTCKGFRRVGVAPIRSYIMGALKR